MVKKILIILTVLTSLTVPAFADTSSNDKGWSTMENISDLIKKGESDKQNTKANHTYQDGFDFVSISDYIKDDKTDEQTTKQDAQTTQDKTTQDEVTADGKQVVTDNIHIKDTTGKWSGNKFINWEGKFAVNEWIRTNNKLYYVNELGLKQTGWKLIKDDWYYFNQDGTTYYGWLLYGNSWYYLQESGKMKVGWLLWEKDKNWYYLTSNGNMLTNSHIDGCYITPEGCWSDEFERRKEDGTIYHDYTELILSKGYTLENINTASIEIKYGNQTFTLTQFSLKNSDGNDISKDYVLSKEGKVIHPF